jgi:UDPglucose 6-dehydrogenase
MSPEKPLIGFVGQGFIGKNYADEFEERNFSVIRYALETPYSENKEAIATCDVVFVAVPTPTTVGGFDDSNLEKVLPLVGKGASVVIKSTLLPGSTEKLQAQFPGIFIFHSPEFLREVTAAYDARNPDRNIIGTPIANYQYQEKARWLLSLLPRAPYEKVCTSREAELIKYLGNAFLTTKVIFINMAYDLAEKIGADWGTVSEVFSNDPRIGKSHLNPVHQSGRGAGGHCFIKDYEALLRYYAQEVGDEKGMAVFKAIKEKNIDLLKKSGKDLDLLGGVYGDNF